MIKVLFVCLGNICRSPLAEAVFRKLVKEKRLQDKITCDSAGTSNYHIGDPPDARTLRNARNNGIQIDHQARQFIQNDFERYDYIIAMDKMNLSNIEQLNPGLSDTGKRIFLMRQFENERSFADPENVPDPYFGGDSGFQDVYEILWRTNRNFLEYLIKTHNLA